MYIGSQINTSFAQVSVVIKVFEAMYTEVGRSHKTTIFLIR